MLPKSRFIRNFILLLFLLLFQATTLIAMAQSPQILATTSNRKPSQGTRFGLDAALDMNFLAWPKQLGAHRQPRIGFSAHAWGSFAIKEKLALQVGIGYALRRNSVKWDDVVFSSDIDAQLGVVSYSSMDAEIVSHEVQVPIILKYFFHSRAQGPYLGAGAMLSQTMAMHTKAVIHFGNGITERVDTRNPSDGFNIGLQACIGKTLQFGPSFRLGVELYGSRYFEKVTLVYCRPLVLGLRVSHWF